MTRWVTSFRISTMETRKIDQPQSGHRISLRKAVLNNRLIRMPGMLAIDTGNPPL